MSWLMSADNWSHKMLSFDRRFDDSSDYLLMSVREQQTQPARESSRWYVLMTAAHNEEAFIEKTVATVLAQTVRPTRWVIVSDGSTDRTDQIVESYAKQHEFISFLKLTRPTGRNFGSKGIALQKGCKLLEGVSFEFIGNVDADIAVEPSYFETLIGHFERDPQLGIAAGFVYEEHDGEFRRRASNRTDSVPHAAQLVRRDCYEAIGGYSIFKYGGEDWYAQQCAKMNGWHAEAIPGLKVFHERNTGTANNLLRHHFRLGRLDHSFGSDPVFEFLKCALRVSEKPWFLGAVSRFLGFAWSSVIREKRPVSKEFVDFLRKEQRAKVRGVFLGTGRERLQGVRTP
jgi:glycosyltransferase involved in cell wall biosynthesis